MTNKKTYKPAASMRRRWIVASMTGIIFLTGCSALRVQDDVNDACYSQRVALRGSENYFAQSVVEGALTGAVSGAAIGALSAFMRGGDIGKSAAIGAGAGAITGGVTSYYLAKQKNIADAKALATSIQSDIVRENGEIDRTAITFANIRNCRFSAAERIKADYRAGHLQRDEALKKLTAIKEKFDEDIEIAEKMGTKMSQNMVEFQNASTQMLDKDPVAKAQLALIKNPPPPTPQPCGKKPTKGCAPKNTKPPTKQPAPIEKTPAVEMALAAETNQSKQKEFADTLKNSKVVDAAKLVNLDDVAGDAKKFIMLEALACAR